MAVSLGTLGSPLVTGTSIVPLPDVDTQSISKEYGVGNFAQGMQVVFDTPEGQPGYDTIHVATEYDSGSQALTITEGLTADLPAGTTVYKVYEGAHGTEPEHLRKRLLGYI
jgi:hypothetical protein